MVGSHFMSFQSPTYSAVKDIKKTKDLITKDAKLTDKQTLPDGRVKIYDIEKKSLGRIENILFWNEDQLKLYNTLKTFTHTVIAGDYGTGKTVVAAAIADYCDTHPDVKEVHYISLLDLAPFLVNLSKENKARISLILEIVN